jgi:hypothetical protein
MDKPSIEIVPNFIKGFSNKSAHNPHGRAAQN